MKFLGKVLHSLVMCCIMLLAWLEVVAVWMYLGSDVARFQATSIWDDFLKMLDEVWED